MAQDFIWPQEHLILAEINGRVIGTCALAVQTKLSMIVQATVVLRHEGCEFKRFRELRRDHRELCSAKERFRTCVAVYFLGFFVLRRSEEQLWISI
jgi:hypothetical protein